jgi:AAA15 family ATPase/GTPase
MRIKSFSYNNEDWTLQEIDLQKVNLLVGKNGTGKSKTISHLDSLVNFIAKWELYITNLDTRWEISWVNDNDTTFSYTLQIHFDENSDNNVFIFEELLMQNDDILIQRNEDGSCQIYSETNKLFDIYNPPSNKLALLSRRDTKAYPYIEDIINWANHSYELSFSSINSNELSVEIESSSYEDYPKVYSRLNGIQQQSVLNNFNSIGFNIATIKHESKGTLHYLVIKEKGLDAEIFEETLSQGMLRALCLLIYIEYLISKNKKATLLIDDLGEGLDYERATKLGKMLFKLCEENNIQLIATSNDSFLMDVIDIDYWNVLIREGKVVKAINKANRPQIFEDFRFEGTSNFNFFASSYLPSRL